MTVPVLKACRAAVFFVALALTAPALSQTADELSTQGRAAASRNENAEAARLFGEAIRVDPARRPALLREYADQLAFSGRPAEAVLLYRERLAATDLDAAARAALERGLALALLWSGAFDEAAPTLEALSNAAPTDAELRRAFVDAVVGSARAAAGRGANKEAVERFERALAIDPARRPDIAREFADQLAFSGEPARAVPVYREVASRADLPDEERRRTTRSLAFALLWSGAFREAIPAWEAILRENAGDDEARRGLADALVGSARREAEAGRNAGAVTSFRRALDTAPGRRRELLAELADQVAYAGRPGDAVPLYREGLRQTDRPAEELARLRRGLAFALLWSGSFAEASRALEEVLAAAPDDAEVRKALADAREKRATPVAPRRPEAPSAVARPSPAQGSPSGPAAAPAASPAPPQTETDRAIAAARAAAGRGANKEAVEGFERALAIAPGRRPEIAREYADQLAFSGQPARAVPLYREVLARENLPADERRRAARALAFALLWSSQFDDAIPAWERILSGLPGDAEARRALADAHVGAARKAAETRRNAAAVRQFEAAIRVEPSRRRELLPELADQVAYAGRPSDAVPLYREGLAQAGRTPAERARLGRGLAFALLWSNQFREAAAAWRAILAANPSDGEARKALSDALVGAARASAGARRHADAAGLFREAIGLQPGRRGELLREYAEQVLYAGRAAEATPLFEELLARPNLTPVERRAAQLGLARSYAWSNRPAESLPWYGAILAANPADVEALVGRGQALNSLARHPEALADFEAALAVTPGNRDAIRGAAQAESSMQRFRTALARLEPLIAAGDRDPATLIIAAYARRGMGRPDLAEDLAREILRVRPGDEGATKLVRELLDERRPLTEIDGSHARRSDALSISTLMIFQQLTFQRGIVTVGPQARFTRFRGGPFPEVDIASLGLRAQARFNDWLEFRTSFFFNAEDEPTRSDLAFTHETSLSYIPSDTWRFGLQAARRYPDENTRSIVNDILADDVGVSVDFTPDGDARLTGRAIASRYTDGNRRLWGQLEAERRVVRGERELRLGTRLTGFDFARVLDNGYWNPDRYGSAEGTIHAYGRIAEGWRYDVQAAAGYAWTSPGDGGSVFSAVARLTYETSAMASVSLYANHLTSYARSSENGGVERQGNDEPFRRTGVGVQLRLRW